MVQECVGLSEELFLMCTSIKIPVEDINTTKQKRMMKNQGIKRQFFSKSRQFLYLNIFREW